MKYAAIGFAIIAISAAAIGLQKAAEHVKEPVSLVSAGTGKFEPLAVLELFTSQGCSSCPSADKLLSQTIHDDNNKAKKIYALSFHVDYWNRLGWTDPFSSAAFSKRQTEYVSALHSEGAYTPQMIINGTEEFVGSDKTSLSKGISAALNTKAELSFTKLNAVYEDKGVIRVDYELEGNITAEKINFALVSLGETTAIRRGENGGLVLKNENIVRQLLTEKALSSGRVEFASTPAPTKANAAVIAFVQEANGTRIVGAAMATFN